MALPNEEMVATRSHLRLVAFWEATNKVVGADDYLLMSCVRSAITDVLYRAGEEKYVLKGCPCDGAGASGETELR